MSINRRQLLASSAAVSAMGAALNTSAKKIESHASQGPISSFDGSQDTLPGATGFNIEDRLAIVNLCNSYASGYDADDFERWLMQFTSDPVCTIYNPGAEPIRVAGDEFRHLFKQFRNSATNDNVQPLHYNGNLMIKAQTADTAIAEMYMFYIPFDVTAQDNSGIHSGALSITGTSRYRFEMVKGGDNVWRIAEYTISFDQKTV